MYLTETFNYFSFSYSVNGTFYLKGVGELQIFIRHLSLQNVNVVSLSASDSY